MDHRLITWARQVKSRQRRGHRLPVLWLFSDPRRLPDPTAAAAALPVGLCGIVLRHDGPATTPAERDARLRHGRRLAGICRARRLVLQVAGDRRLAQALGAGIHLRRGRGGPPRPGRCLLTSSAHDGAEILRARRRGAAAVFLSPCFVTASHPGASLGVLRWTALAVRRGVPVLALGGIDGHRARALPPRLCAGAGAIDALAATGGDMAGRPAKPGWRRLCGG